MPVNLAVRVRVALVAAEPDQLLVLVRTAPQTLLVVAGAVTNQRLCNLAKAAPVS